MSFDLASVLGGAAELNSNSLQEIDLELIDGDERNFYSMDANGIEALAANIETCGLLDPIRVRKNPDRPGRYIVVSGHRRRAACMLIRDGGNADFKSVSCIVEEGGSAAMQELRLIYANANTRALSSPELAMQAERVKELLYALKGEGVEFPGRMREHVAQACQITSSKLARLEAIKNKLAPEFMTFYDSGKMSEAVAYSLSTMPAEAQKFLSEKPQIIKAAQKGKLNSQCISEAAAAIKDGSYISEPKKCPLKGVESCEYSAGLERVAAMASREYYYHRSCEVGKCCLKCSSHDSCKMLCPHARAKLADDMAKAKKENEKSEAKAKIEREELQNARRTRQTAQVERLAELIKRAELPEDMVLPMAPWMRTTAGGVLKLAESGFGADAQFYGDDFGGLDGIKRFENLAAMLKCTVGELAGEQAAPVFNLNTWRDIESFPGKTGGYIMLGKNKKAVPEYCWYDADEDRLFWDEDDRSFGETIKGFSKWAEVPTDAEDGGQIFGAQCAPLRSEGANILESGDAEDAAPRWRTGEPSRSGPVYVKLDLDGSAYTLAAYYNANSKCFCYSDDFDVLEDEVKGWVYLPEVAE